MDNTQVKLLNPLTLAYVGDAIYEVYVRKHLVQSGQVNPHEMHRRAVTFVSAQAQAQIIHKWLSDEELSEAEVMIFKRGRNAKSGSVPKNASIQDYRYATGFETLIGYLYLTEDIERLEILIKKAIMFVEN